MNRRNLLLSLGAFTVTFFLRPTLALSNTPQKILCSGDHCIAGAGEVIQLPENPCDKDCVHVVVDKKSLSYPALLKSRHYIMGDSEPLVLDSMAILKLEFHRSTGNWILS